VWETTVDGRQLHFHLAGINNQNFIMRDEETGSWWQQVTGEAIRGPLKGKRLKAVFLDQLTFGTWRLEEPNGRVLKPDETIVAKGEYAAADWEEKMTHTSVATLLNDQTLEPKALVVGIRIGEATKAYPFTALQKQNPIIDTIGGTPIIIVLADDHRSVRAFDRRVDGRPRDLFLKADTSPLRLIDLSGNEWNFTGTAVTGPLVDNSLLRIPVLEDYWFDWKTYNPQTALYSLAGR
jgi:uncharacterized protein DUF3179